MHKSVQYDIAEDYGYAIEVIVLGPQGKGRLDLYDPSQNEYYEVKHRPAAAGTLFENQMKKYDSSYVTDWRFIGYHLGEGLDRGDNALYGETMYKYWDIYYQTADDGVIIYTWVLNEKRYNQYLASVATVATGALAGYAYGKYGGVGHGIRSCSFDVK